MNTKTMNRIVRGAAALAAFGLAAQQYAETGFSAMTAFVGGIGLVFAWMAASGKG